MNLLLFCHLKKVTWDSHFKISTSNFEKVNKHFFLIDSLFKDKGIISLFANPLKIFFIPAYEVPALGTVQKDKVGIKKN